MEQIKRGGVLHCITRGRVPVDWERYAGAVKMGLDGPMISTTSTKGKKEKKEKSVFSYLSLKVCFRCESQSQWSAKSDPRDKIPMPKTYS